MLLFVYYLCAYRNITGAATDISTENLDCFEGNQVVIFFLPLAPDVLRKDALHGKALALLSSPGTTASRIFLPAEARSNY